MLADPLTLTTDWTTITADATENFVFPALERAADHSSYGTFDAVTQEKMTLFVGHQYGRRNRFTVRLTVDGLTPDLILDGNNSKFSQSCYVVFDCPPTGPVNPAAYSTISLPHYMMKAIGGLLIGINDADPVFQRVVNGET